MVNVSVMTVTDCFIISYFPQYYRFVVTFHATDVTNNARAPLTSPATNG